jgi:hypothetical protein
VDELTDRLPVDVEPDVAAPARLVEEVSIDGMCGVD